MVELTQLGSKTPLPASPQEAVLECIPWHGKTIIVKFEAPEWTGLCPVTGAPDFGDIVVWYIPNEKLIESKSFKLLIGSYRNYGCFHEAVVDYIADRIDAAAQPYWLRITGKFAARGGVAINAFCERGKWPDDLPVIAALF